jgi:hypothetical protein
MMMPGFTADESLSPPRGNYRAHAARTAARYGVLPQMQSVMGTKAWAGFWTSLVTGASYGGGGGGGVGGSGGVIDSCVWGCWFAYKADLIECDDYDSASGRSRCRIDATNRYLDCTHECSLSHYPYP